MRKKRGPGEIDHPGKSGIYLAKLTAEDKGEVSPLLGSLKSLGVRVIVGMYTIEKNGTVEWIGLVRLPEPIDTRVLEDRIKSMAKVREAILRNYKLGWVFGTPRLIAVPPSLLLSFLHTFYTSFGTGGKAMIFHAGRTMGEELYDAFRGRDLYETIENLLLFLKQLNFLRSYRLDSTSLKVWGAVECSAPSKSPRSQLLRGMLSGIVSKMLGKAVIFEERRCSSMGDEYCEFILVEA